MAARLQMKLGVVTEHDRLPDSPDTVVVVEPSVGSVARSKGHLYLLVTSAMSGPRAREATRLAAETIRNEYYYDESSGIRTSLQKAIGLANKRLGHQRERLGLGLGEEAQGPIGIAVAVLRGTELYVTSVGPADTYLVRQARLSTLPHPDRDRGLPTATVRPDVWRGEIQVGDELLLISRNVVRRLGIEELKDALVTLHPQSAMEHLHHRFVASGGSGSDAAIAFEAAEIPTPVRARDLEAARASGLLVERSDRTRPSSGDLSDEVAALGPGQAQEGPSPFDRAVVRFQDLMPVQRQTYRRVTPLSARRETQRRAAVAALAFITVAFGLGMAVFLAPRDTSRPQVAATVSVGQRALEAARASIARVFGPGVDLVEEDPEEALAVLSEAYTQLDQADEAGIAASTIRPLREQVVAGLERLSDVTTVDDRVLFAFDPNANPAIDLAGVVPGPDGAPYVLDRTTKSVWRINTKTQHATLAVREGSQFGGLTAALPRFLATGGPDQLTLDANNVLWRWRPAEEVGAGTLTVTGIEGADAWGPDIVAMGTFITNPDAGTYNLYVVDPSENQILAATPLPGDGGFSAATPWLAETRPMAGVTGIHIDGDIYLADGGSIERFAAGQPDGWEPGSPGDDLLREDPRYTIIAAASGRRAGRIYAYDQANARVLAFDKAEATFVEQFRLPEGNDGWTDLRGMYLIESAEGPPILVWVSSDVLHASRLVEVDPPPAPSASPGTDASAAPSPAATP